MKVRVKEGQKGFIYGVLRSEGDEFNLKEYENNAGENVTIESQFSKVWMEAIDKPKKAGRPPKTSKAEEI